MVYLISAILSATFSESAMTVGNIPILDKMLPNNFGTFFIKASEQINESYFLAHFLIYFLSLLNLVKPSSLIQPSLLALASSQCFMLPMTPIFKFGLGTCGNLMEPVNLLSLSGS